MNNLVCKRCSREFHGIVFHYIIQGCLFGYIKDKVVSVPKQEEKDD